MKKRIKKQTIVFLLAGLTGSVFAQGSLTPPGAPGATMKTLTQVEPRTPISSSPTSIRKSGSYYLTTNLTGGISISTNNVTLDLMGFSIIAASGNAVSLSSGCSGIVVRNGTLSAPTGNGMDFSVSSTNANGLIEGLFISGCQNYGIAVGGGFLVRDCKVQGTDMAGIRAYGNSEVRDCTVTACEKGLQLSGTGARVENNRVFGNADNYDFSAGNQLNLLLCQIPENIDWSASVKLAGSLESSGHGVVVRANDVTLDLMGFTLNGDRSSGDYGIFLDGATNSAIWNVVVRNGIVRNFNCGFRAEYVQACRFEHLIIATNSIWGIYLYGYSGQCDGNTLADCTISGNSSFGICLDGGYGGRCDGNTLVNCTVSGNGSYGICLFGDSGQCDGNTVTGCTIRKNAGRGIYLSYADGNRVEGNHISGQTGNPSYGILSTNTVGNLIFRNTCVGQTNNFTITANDTYGPIVTNTGALTTTNGAAGLSPWANFSR